MGRLFLFRHGKAKWADPGMRDFDRVLDPTGETEALAMGQAMKAAGLVPTRIICSNAIRARQTVEQINDSLGLEDATTYTDELYATDAPGYLEIARSVRDADDIMIVGHNPMLEDLALGISASGDEDALSELQMGFRTAGLAVIDFDGPPASFSDTAGHLTVFMTPANL